MNNQEKLTSFLESFLKERLIFFSTRPKRDLSTKGAMYFIQETKTVGGKEYYVTNKSKYYPNGLIEKTKLLNMMKEHSKENPLQPNNIEMIRIGKYMGSTHCRCCGESLGNGGGGVIFDYNDKKYSLGLTGGADHYLKHNININLISYTWESKEKNIKLHTQFVGDVKDIHEIENFINILEPEQRLKNSVQHNKNSKKF